MRPNALVFIYLINHDTLISLVGARLRVVMQFTKVTQLGSI
jgi:hypothetical protein